MLVVMSHSDTTLPISFSRPFFLILTWYNILLYLTVCQILSVYSSITQDH